MDRSGPIAVLLLDRDARRCGDRLTALARAGCFAAESAETVHDWLPRAGRLDPDVLVVSADTLGREEIKKSIAALEPSLPDVRWILADVGGADGEAEEFALGAWGILDQGATFPEFLEAVRRVAAGQTVLSGEQLGQLMRRLQEQVRLAPTLPAGPNVPAGVRLTVRERQVLGLMAERRTNREIAAALQVELGTVKNHFHSVLKKLALQNRQQAVYVHPRVAAAPPAAGLTP